MHLTENDYHTPMTRNTLAHRLIKTYRQARKLYRPSLARVHAYFKINTLIGQTQYRKYNNRYWNQR